MQTIRIPNTDLDVSRFALGTGSFGTHLKGEQARKLVERYFELGGNFFDTAHCYAFWEPNGLGLPERELAAVLRDLGRLDNAVIATKGGHPAVPPDYPRPDDYLSEAVVTKDIDDSLERLGLDSVDVYYVHRDDSRVPVGEIIEMLNREVDKGRIRHLGASNWSVERIEEANAYATAHGLKGFVVSQILWCLATPKWKMGSDPTNRHGTPHDAAWYAAHHMPVPAYSAAGNGYFSGRTGGQFDTPENAAIAERVNTVAEQIGATPTQVAVAWLLHLPATVLPLFSTGHVDHLEEVIGAAEVALSPEQITALTAD